jgi:hypothetical protein
MSDLEYFTVTSAGIGAIGVDYVDPDTHPDETVVFAFVDFVPREPAGTVHWLSGLTPPRGVQLDAVRARYSPEDGQLRTIIGNPNNEKQLITVTGNLFTLTYSGQPTANIAHPATPAQVQAALEALSNIAVGDVYVSGKMQNEKQTITISTATGGTFKLATAAAPTEWTGPISRTASASSVQAFLQALSTIGSDGCSVTGPTGGPWIVQFTGTLAGVEVGLLVKDQSLLTPSGTITIVQTVQGSTGTPFTVNFVGSLQGTDVSQMSATNATVSTVTAGTADLGVELVANTPVLELGVDKDGHDVELIYDVVFTVPDLDPFKEDRKVSPFAIAAPKTGGMTGRDQAGHPQCRCRGRDLDTGRLPALHRRLRGASQRRASAAGRHRRDHPHRGAVADHPVGTAGLRRGRLHLAVVGGPSRRLLHHRPPQGQGPTGAPTRHRGPLGHRDHRAGSGAGLESGVSLASPANRLDTMPAELPTLTLGWEGVKWASMYLRQPNGPRVGQRFEFTTRQLRFILHWYALNDDGSWVYHHGARRLAKGSGKSPFAAALALIEFCA